MQKDAETFKLESLLGTGGFAQTWKARVLDPYLSKKWGVQEVAIKIPLSRQKEIALINEIQLNGALYMKLSSMESKNIAQYLSFDKFDGWIVMVMKYIKGGSLRETIGAIDSLEPTDVNKAISIIQGVLEGLSVIHKNHIIHRDIKPENILMDGDIPKISDLGIGRMLGPNEMASTSIGTIQYMSPEILYVNFEGCRASFNSDIWSVGITFFEMLFGRFPFGINAKSYQGDLVRIIADKNIKLEFPKDIPIPHHLKKIIEKSLERSPRERYQNVDEMLADLNKLSSGENEEIQRAVNQIQELFNTPEQLQDYEKRFQEILKKYPNSSRIHLTIGEFYNKCGSYEKALAAFKNGLLIDPDNATLHWGTAMSYQMMKKNALAVQWLERALECGLQEGLERYARVLIKTLQNTSK